MSNTTIPPSTAQVSGIGSVSAVEGRAESNKSRSNQVVARAIEEMILQTMKFDKNQDGKLDKGERKDMFSQTTKPDEGGRSGSGGGNERDDNSVGGGGKVGSSDSRSPSLAADHGGGGRRIGGKSGADAGGRAKRADKAGGTVGGKSDKNKTDIRGTRGDDYHYQNKDGVETFRIGSGDKPAGEKTDPRSEFVLKEDSFKPGDGTRTFSADFQVKSGNDTTIAQIINADPSDKDKHKPTAFVTFEDGNLYQGHKKEGNLLTHVGNEKFNLSITSTGTKYSIKVDGKDVGSFDTKRESGENYFKYGAYHHGEGQAEVNVSNAKVTRS
jgi:hypothetical protein